LLPAGAKVAGWVFHPLGNAAFPRRTHKADYCRAAKSVSDPMAAIGRFRPEGDEATGDTSACAKPGDAALFREISAETDMSDLVPQNTLIRGQRIANGVHGAGEPVVLIHGTPSSSYIWRNVVPELVDTGYKVLLFDLLGYGLSERPWDSAVDTSVTGQVPILKGSLEHWGLDRTHIVAHDIGGAVAQRFCIFNPQSVKSLTLIDTVSFDSWPSKGTNEQMKAGLDMLVKKSDAEHRGHFQNWILSTVHDEERLRAESLATFVNYISGPVGQGSFFQHQVQHYDHKHTSELNDRIGELGKLPVRILWGEDDAWQVVDWAHKLHAAIPGSHLHILPECGHFAMEDKQQTISELLKAFLLAHSGK